ncbi:MAG: glycosyltransferase [Lachnospiraceae bacterium]|nr:glycosyltransferase [Lachnospiraceae bacterium]
MNREKKLRISQCMIVKNEEQKIERALSWGRDVIWERVVVDTGSTDRTVELAEKWGAKVYHFPWIDDFAAARNYALDQAQGDWILTLDADEYPAPGTADKLLPVLAQAEEKRCDGIFGEIMELDEKEQITICGSRIRLYRNTKEIRYRRRIHEQLVRADGREMRLADAGRDVVFFHDGYAEEAYAQKQRSQRNLRLLERELADHPEDYEVMGYLGDEYQSFGETEQAAEWYRRSVDGMPERLAGSDPRSAHTFWSLISIYLSGGEEQKAEAVYRQAVRLLPEEADFDYQMGCHCVSAGRWKEGLAYLAQGLGKLERYKTANSSMKISADLENVYGNLALCYLRCGQLQQAVQTSVALLKVKPYDMKVLYILLAAFYQDGGERADGQEYVRGIAGFLEKLYCLSSQRDRLFIARAAREAGWDTLERQIKEGQI